VNIFSWSDEVVGLYGKAGCICSNGVLNSNGRVFRVLYD